jgi:hypothetical protein
VYTLYGSSSSLNPAHCCVCFRVFFCVCLCVKLSSCGCGRAAAVQRGRAWLSARPPVGPYNRQTLAVAVCACVQLCACSCQLVSILARVDVCLCVKLSSCRCWQLFSGAAQGCRRGPLPEGTTGTVAVCVCVAFLTGDRAAAAVYHVPACQHSWVGTLRPTFRVYTGKGQGLGVSVLGAPAQGVASSRAQ